MASISPPTTVRVGLQSIQDYRQTLEFQGWPYPLSQNYPNPFNPTTTISFSLPSRSIVSLKVFDILGREVSTIVSAELQARSYTRQWNAANMASGVYFYKLAAGSIVETMKLMVIK